MKVKESKIIRSKKRAFFVFCVAIIAIFHWYCETAKAQEDFCIDVYNPDAAYNGTTLLPDNHIPRNPRVVEVDMKGGIIWEYVLPASLRRYTNPGFDAELLPNGNILLVLPGKGLYEIDRAGNPVWSYMDSKVSHDADRLPNGNTLVVFGNNDGKQDAQAKEVNQRGKIVWSWSAKEHFDEEPYKNIYNQGWTHANAVSRLSNGNTLISLRNFGFVVEVDSQGSVVRKIGDGILHHQHDPEMLPNGNVLIANHRKPQGAIEINPASGRVIWRFDIPDSGAWPVRDADRLPNGNTLITGTTKIIEVTSEGEIVWQLSLKGVSFEGKEAAGRGFYKALRVKQ